MVLEAKYPFIQEDVFLIARVYEKKDEIPSEKDASYKAIWKGKQELVMQYIDLNTEKVLLEDKFSCIHAAVTEFTFDEFIELHKNLENDIDAQKAFYQKTLNIQSTEKLKTIDLPLSDKFFAFKSWVSGIAESGFEALNIQHNLDHNLQLAYPIASFLLRCLVRIDVEYIPIYLRLIERNCVYNGKLHEPNVLASLEVFTKIIKWAYDSEIHRDYIYTHYDKLVNLRNQMGYINTITTIFSYLLEFYPTFLFKNTDEWVRTCLAFYPKIIEDFPNEYRLFFTDEYWRVRQAVAFQPESSDFEEFKLLFSDKDYKVLVALVNNSKAYNFQEIKSLFNHENPSVRFAIAKQIYALRYDEYKQFFTDKNSDVRRAIKENEFVKRKYPDLFKKLIPKEISLDDPEACKYEEFKLYFYSESIYELVSFVKNPNIYNYEEVRYLFTHPIDLVRFNIAGNPKSCKYEEYKLLFKDEEYGIRSKVAENPEACKFEEYKLLFTDKHNEVRFALAKNRIACNFEEFSILLNDKVDYIRKTALETSHNYCLEVK